ncbi:collagen alpha-1(XXII) chain-like isoform X2 [Vombatus ursinus]|uniref:collagen alpha-1(XXII) chain-like isoform X2 n=1 Tax=Vombatus ursinus TaxID=29139 RepID=UPI000FFDB2C3|nr:collagen alpha-1(XXII) chain-like isoform X2 [Vombatus ursinus]
MEVSKTEVATHPSPISLQISSLLRQPQFWSLRGANHKSGIRPSTNPAETGLGDPGLLCLDHGAVSALSLFVGDPGPAGDLGRLSLHEVFLHRHGLARAPGAAVPRRGLRGRSAVRALRQRPRKSEDGAPGGVDGADGPGGPGLLGGADPDLQGAHREVPSGPEDPAPLLQPERGRGPHPPGHVLLRGLPRAHLPAWVSTRRLRRAGLPDPGLGDLHVDCGGAAGSEHQAQVGGGQELRGGTESLRGGGVRDVAEEVPGDGEGDAAESRSALHPSDPPHWHRWGGDPAVPGPGLLPRGHLPDLAAGWGGAAPRHGVH